MACVCLSGLPAGHSSRVSLRSRIHWWIEIIRRTGCGGKTKYEPAKPQKAIDNSLLASTLFSRGASLAQDNIAIIIRLNAGTRLPERKPSRLLLEGRIWVCPKPPRPFPIELQSPPRLMRKNSWLGFRVTSLCGGILGYMRFAEQLFGILRRSLSEVVMTVRKLVGIYLHPKGVCA